MNLKEMEEKVIDELKKIYDPEIPVNIYDLGLIYNIAFGKEDEGLKCIVTMTLTSAACPVSESLVDQVRNIGFLIEEINVVEPNLVFDPPWTQDNMSDEAKLHLGML